MFAASSVEKLPLKFRDESFKSQRGGLDFEAVTFLSLPVATRKRSVPVKESVG